MEDQEIMHHVSRFVIKYDQNPMAQEIFPNEIDDTANSDQKTLENELDNSHNPQEQVPGEQPPPQEVEQTEPTELSPQIIVQTQSMHTPDPK